MLENSFCHIRGVGVKLERRLWKMGYRDWETLLSDSEPRLFRRRLARIGRSLERSKAELASGNSTFFAESLPPSEQWRLFGEFRKSVAYVDIETTGMGPLYDSITTIALYDGHDVRCYVRDRNLDEFAADIEEFKLIVTYNGKCFDVPMIERSFGIEIAAAHIDLRYVLKSLGYSGGLKGCEKQMGIDRGALDGVDGYFAVILWHDYTWNGNERALETLLAYNVEDTVNLETLMVRAYNAKLEGTPFRESHYLDEPRHPLSPYRPDLATIARLRTAGAY